MRFGLILCTYGRDWSVVGKFIYSLVSNTYKNWELIIVDQNEDSRIKEGLKEYYSSYLGEGKIKYYKVNFKGLSASRNYGLSKLGSDVDIIGFPDDDCEYPEDLLAKVLTKFMTDCYVDVVIGVGWDNVLKRYITKPIKDQGFVNLLNVWRVGSSITTFVKVKEKGMDKIDFDERLGVGSKYVFGFAEDIDFVIRLIKSGFVVKFYRDLIVYHPYKELETDLNRFLPSIVSIGAVFRKNFCINHYFIAGFFKHMLVGPIVVSIFYLLRLNPKKAKVKITSLLLKWAGFFTWGCLSEMNSNTKNTKT